MRSSGPSHVVAIVLIGLAAAALSPPRVAHAFARPAVFCVAQRLGSALPPGARSGPGDEVAIAEAVARQLDAQVDDPEQFAACHRFAVGSPLPAESTGPFADGVAAVDGFAPRQLEAAAAALRRAYAGRNRQAIVEQLAALAIAATDLADPFQVVGLDQPEAPGARAAFSDLVVGSLPAALEARESVSVNDPVAAGRALAVESAGQRGAIEEALRLGDIARLEDLRHQRLAAALTLVQAIASQTWRGTEEPAAEPEGPAAVRVWPNPVRLDAQLSFAIPAASQVTVEVFDLAGRKLWSKSLGPLAAGSHTTLLPAAALRAAAPGIYLVRLSTPRFAATGRLIYQRH